MKSKTAKVVELNDEAKAAIKRKSPTDKRLIQILISNLEKTMPVDYEARQLAATALLHRGYMFRMKG